MNAPDKTIGGVIRVGVSYEVWLTRAGICVSYDYLTFQFARADCCAPTAFS